MECQHTNKEYQRIEGRVQAVCKDCNEIVALNEETLVDEVMRFDSRGLKTFNQG